MKKQTAPHTPGPWLTSLAYGNGSALWIGPEYGPSMVLQGANCLKSDTVKHEQISIDQLLANSQLIAAAPDLLEALKAMVEIAELTIGWFPAPPDADGPLIQARAAIAKATGGAV